MRIEAAAVQYNGRLYTGYMHADCADMLGYMTDGGIDDYYFDLIDLGLVVEGFVTECGRFVTRVEALGIAREAGQIAFTNCYNYDGLLAEDLNHNQEAA